MFESSANASKPASFCVCMDVWFARKIRVRENVEAGVAGKDQRTLARLEE